MAANDTYATATDLATFTSPQPGLRVSDTEADYLSMVVPADHKLSANVVTDGRFGTPELRMWDVNPSTFTAAPVDTDIFGPDYDVDGVNLTGADATFTLEVLAGACMEYELEWEVIDCAVDDALEPNDDVTTAIAATSGTDLHVRSGSDDFFALGTVADGDAIAIDVTFIHALGDIDIRLLDENGTQLGAISGVDDLENIVWTNATGLPTDVVLRVFHFGLADCLNNVYDFTSTITTP